MIFRSVQFFLVFVLIMVVLLKYVIGIAFVSGVSMRETYKSGDMVIYSRVQKDITYG